MKRVLVAILFFVSLPSFGLIRLGVGGGLTSSNGTFDTAVTTSSRSGFAVGPALELGLGAGWNIQIEGLYIQKGYKSTTLGVETTYKYDYWEFPVLLKYVIDIPVVKPFLEAGPYFGFKLKSESTNNITNLTTTIVNIKSTDLGLSFGGGADIYISPVSSIFGVIRYDLGLGNILDTTTTSSVKLNTLLFMAGLMFGF